MQNDAKPMKRKYFPADFEVTTWEKLEVEFGKLLAQEIGSADGLVSFWEKVSELGKIIEDRIAWLYIDMTRFADKPEKAEAFNGFMADIGAKSQPYGFRLAKKFHDSPFRAELPEKYAHLGRIIANDIELYREENIPLSVKEQELAARYGELTSKMTVMFDGEEKTIQQLASYLEDKDRGVREKAWRLKMERYGQDQKEMDVIFDQLKAIRVRIAKNAGFENYRDYMHQAKGRFSYSVDDLLRLHEAVEKVIVPLLEELNDERKRKLGV